MHMTLSLFCAFCEHFFRATKFIIVQF